MEGLGVGCWHAASIKMANAPTIEQKKLRIHPHDLLACPRALRYSQYGVEQGVVQRAGPSGNATPLAKHRGWDCEARCNPRLSATGTTTSRLQRHRRMPERAPRRPRPPGEGPVGR